MIKTKKEAGPKTRDAHRAPVGLDECALARAIRAIGDGWTLLILREALCGVERFDAMHEDLGIPRSVLAQRLARLVEAGILQQHDYREPGRRTRKAYVITAKGRGLVPALVAMRSWAEDNLPEGRSRLRMRDRDGQEVFTRLVRADGSTVEDFSGVRAAIGERRPARK